MNAVKADFTERFSDVNRLYEHIDKLSKANGNVDIILILKASLYIALYNNIEAVIYSILERIHEEVSVCEYKKVTPNIKNMIIEYYLPAVSGKKRNFAIKNIADFNLKLPSFSQYQSKKNVFSGNLDVKAIREIFKKYGIIFKYNINSTLILEVKNKRNKIAHGECSLSDAGKNVKLEGLKKTVTSVECLLNECMLQTENFLMNHRYLDPSN
ncbi:MAE_28990/MAE_18760 family HEPN-like nuclease [Escherichia coli]